MAIAFVGPLSRYYAKQPEDAVLVQPGIEAWREDLRASVADKVRQQLYWDEAADVVFRADLGEAGWSAVRLLALYAERADLELPDTVPALLELDPAWREAADRKFEKSLYGQLLACSVWLPGDYPVTMRAPLPNGDTAEIGSIAVLNDQLKWLNQRTFGADLDQLAAWRDLPAPARCNLLDAARRGYSALAAAVTTAQRFSVPVLVEA